MEQTYTITFTAEEIKMLRVALFTKECLLDDAVQPQKAQEYGRLYEKVRRCQQGNN